MDRLKTLVMIALGITWKNLLLQPTKYKAQNETDNQYSIDAIHN